MKKNFTIPFLIAIFSILTFGSCNSSNDSSQSKKPYNNVLYTSSMDKIDGSEARIREVYFPPGWKTPRHYHNGNLFIYVVEGEFELTMEPLGKKLYKSGDALQMKSGVEMDARNPSNSKSLKMAVFHIGEPNEPFFVPVEVNGDR